jgi:hypothetical protein
MKRYLKPFIKYIIFITISFCFLGCSYGLKHINKNQKSDKSWQEIKPLSNNSISQKENK